MDTSTTAAPSPRGTPAAVPLRRRPTRPAGGRPDRRDHPQLRCDLRDPHRWHRVGHRKHPVRLRYRPASRHLPRHPCRVRLRSGSRLPPRHQPRRAVRHRWLEQDPVHEEPRRWRSGAEDRRCQRPRERPTALRHHLRREGRPQPAGQLGRVLLERHRQRVGGDDSEGLRHRHRPVHRAHHLLPGSHRLNRPLQHLRRCFPGVHQHPVPAAW